LGVRGGGSTPLFSLRKKGGEILSLVPSSTPRIPLSKV
jgi:hypothetical protein